MELIYVEMGAISDGLFEENIGVNGKRREVLSGWFLSNYCEGFIELVVHLFDICLISHLPISGK